MTARQQILYLWLSESALDSEVVAWAFHDGTKGEGDPPPEGDPPYRSGVAAIQDGWMLLQTPQVGHPVPGREAEPGYLQYEFVLERRCEVGHE